jgi:catechol 2,3-dioxygenase-like lactoylglutathione lyase family enzyme
MIGYVLAGSNDVARARAFFDEIFGLLGWKRLIDHGSMTYWGESFTTGAFGVCRPFDRAQASAGNGTMVAIPSPDRATVDAVHARALALGGGTRARPGRVAAKPTERSMAPISAISTETS